MSSRPLLKCVLIIKSPYGTLPDTLPSPSLTARPGSPISIGSRLEELPTAEDNVALTGEESINRRQVMSIDILPDDVLQEIFKLYVDNGFFEEGREKAW